MSEPDQLRVDADAPPAPAPFDAQPSPPAARRPNRTLLAVVAATAVVVLAGLAWFVFAGSSLDSAKETCAPGSAHAQLGDGGDTLALRSVGNKSAGLTEVQLECFLDELEVTDAIRTELGTTRALDGRQSADWDGYHATWTYHPNSGLAMVITAS